MPTIAPETNTAGPFSASGCTCLVDRLAELGYVVRSAVEDDGRGANAELTHIGLEKFRAVRRIHRAGVRRFFLDHLNATDTIVRGDIWDRLSASRRDAVG